MLDIKLKEFQSKASLFIQNYIQTNSNKRILVVKSPTGSGKTIILIDVIDNYLKTRQQPTVFIWLTPGAGELEEQSKNSFQKYTSGITDKGIEEIINEGFMDGDVCFINWEKLINKKNKAIAECEKSNIFNRIKEAHQNNISFILIIDEEHRNATTKAKDIIDAFNPIEQIRVSATAVKDSLSDWYEIDEADAILEGLITKSIFINENIDLEKPITDEEQILIDVADEKRKKIKEEFTKIGSEVNPLVLIQFPNESPKLIEKVENILNKKGISYENGLLSMNMSHSDGHKNYDKDLIRKNDDHVQYLLFKEALGTGWDCPRAKILIKLRDNMNDTFEIQVIGRIRRMPEPTIGHYSNKLLDNSFLYTFDSKYCDDVMNANKYAYSHRPIYLKKQHKDFRLNKEIRSNNFSGIGEREIRTRLYNYFKKKYGLSNDYIKNKEIFINKGFIINENIFNLVPKDDIGLVLTKDYSTVNREKAYFKVNTHTHGIELQHAYGTFRSLIGLDYDKVKDVMETLFRDNRKNKEKLLKLTTNEYYVFIINNQHLFRNDFREGMRGEMIQQSIIKCSEEEWKFPENELFIYKAIKDPEIMSKNVYSNYSDECLFYPERSRPERLFERWLETNCDWYYKNGDKGQEYFSIVYFDGNGGEWLFYPDYITSINKKLWIIETKGGEKETEETNNIDSDSANKFAALKRYAEDRKINWAFVRDKSEKLYYSNTIWTEDMGDEWIPIKELIEKK